MAFLDHSALLPERRALQLQLRAWMLIALAALTIGFAGWALRRLDGNGAGNPLGYGTQLVWRFNCLVFFAGLVASPAGRLIPRLHWLADKSRILLQGFCAAMGVYFGFILLPHVFAVPGDIRSEGISPGMTVFVFFTGSVTVVMAAAITRRLCAQVGDKACRTMLGVAMIYFWLCYSLMGLAHISGPHRPDAFYELSVILMVTGLLVRFADRFFAGGNPASVT